MSFPYIKSPEILKIIGDIKKIQGRMKEDDLKDKEYIEVYDILSREFSDFFDRYTGIFVKVIRGESLEVIASALYYRDKVIRNLITEGELADKLAERYLPKQK